ncbi:MAG: energy-coupling factor transporter transmembrane protein EcfT [Chloroflexi bacterium]|nr:energy-coupling factor transporter transmembrane protein EcfT [Chloroflexota bacterium]MCL5075553.1 energy-coupling factor transporter transmembrane protein EcfT [Chloroflexota bacterium]
MENFEFLRNVTIGQYLPGHSLIHRLDPRTKILGTILLIGIITFSGSYTGNVILLATILALLFISGVSVSYALQGLRPALPFIIVLATLQLLFYGNYPAPSDQAQTLWHWSIVHITSTSIQIAVVSLFRLSELFLLISLLTFTTTATELTYGVESLLRPFTRLGFPAHELAMIITIALRFVPTLAEELERIMKAQASRGADFSPKGQLRFVKQTKQMIPLLIPLFINAFRRAEELIVAMEARCYAGGRGRTNLKHLQASRLDYWAILGLGLYALAMGIYKFSW